MNLVAETWREIAPAPPDAGWRSRRLHPGAPFGLLAARRGGDDAEALIFEIASRSLPIGTSLPDCAGFQVVIEPIESGPGGRCRLCLVLKERRYLDVFATLAQDVVDRVLSSPDEATAVRAFLGRLNTWQRFLERFGTAMLSREEQIGLFAELHLLETEIQPRLGASGAVRAWRGPFGEPQDFRTGSLAIELKATSAISAVSFPVSNLEQLDPGTATSLLLCHVALVENTGGELSLPDLVQRLRTQLSSVDPGAAVEFDAALIEAGYLDIHSATYADRRFAVRKISWYEVREGFPRLTLASVPVGVTASRYTVSLASCAPFEIGKEEAVILIEATRSA